MNEATYTRVLVVTPSVFWRASCRPDFLRLSPQSGAVGDALIVSVGRPSPGDMEAARQRVLSLMR